MVAEPEDQYDDQPEDETEILGQEDEGGDEAPPRRPISPLRYLYDASVSIEKQRIAMNNRIKAIERGADDMIDEIPPVYGVLLGQYENMEHTLDTAMLEELRKRYPIYNEWLRHVKGIGPALASQLLALLLPPLEDRGPSTWYKAAGLYGEERPDGTMRIPQARRGEGKTTYHRWLRRCLYNVGESFVRNGGYYREVYDRTKRRLYREHSWKAARLMDAWESTGIEARRSWLEDRYGKEAIEKAAKTKESAALLEWSMRPTYAKAIALEGNSDDTWPPIRIEKVTRWITVKLFLAHLWERWCIVNGWAPRQPYIVQYGNPDERHHFIPAPLPEAGQKI